MTASSALRLLTSVTVDSPLQGPGLARLTYSYALKQHSHGSE